MSRPRALSYRDPLLIELWGDADAAKRKKKAASETKYTCPSCSVNAWAKPYTTLICGDCREEMLADEPGDDDC
jgi:hypothetical protein